MRNDLTDRAGAARYFLEQLIAAAYDGTVRGIPRMLEEGAGRALWLKERVALHQWFGCLDPEVRAIALELVKLATGFSIF